MFPVIRDAWRIFPCQCIGALVGVSSDLIIFCLIKRIGRPVANCIQVILTWNHCYLLADLILLWVLKVFERHHLVWIYESEGKLIHIHERPRLVVLLKLLRHHFLIQWLLVDHLVFGRRILFRRRNVLVRIDPLLVVNFGWYQGGRAVVMGVFVLNRLVDRF